MRRAAFAVPGDLRTPTGGYAYDRRIIAELGRAGWQIDVVDVGEGFPFPSAAVRQAALTRLGRLPPGLPVVIDGLAFGALPELAGFCAAHPVIALVHHPLALETGLAPDQAASLRTSERASLAGARRVVATSAATARLLVADYGVDPQRIRVARPGHDRVLPARGSAGPVSLLAVGALVPRKGYDVLVAALEKLADLPWRLVIAGDRTRDPATAAAVEAEIARKGLAARITLLGAVSDEALAALYSAADLFVLASRHEGYGMAFATAIAYGLPVIGTRGGAIADTVPSEAGILVAPDDVEALAAALRRLIVDSAERARLAAAARAATLPTWEESARLFAQAIEDLR